MAEPYRSDLGNWHTIYTRLSRWAKKGVLEQVFEELQRAQLVRIKIEAVSMDSTIVKVHPDGTGALKDPARKRLGNRAEDGQPKIQMVAADARTAMTFSLSPGQAHDAPEGRDLLFQMTLPLEPIALLMDKAYEGEETRQLAMTLGYTPVVPPKENRLEPWEYDKALYKRRNEVERLFRRLKGFRRIFSRFEKLDVMFIGFIHFALIVEALRFLC